MGPKQTKKGIAAWTPENKNKINVTKLKPQRVVTFQESMRILLLCGQTAALIPVVGASGLNTENVRFVKKSWRCVYTLLTFFGQIFMTCMCIVRVLTLDTSLKATTSIIFYGTTCITMALFFRTSVMWPKLVRHISHTEQLDPNYNGGLLKKCNITCGIVLCMSLIEHILSLMSAAKQSKVCYPHLDAYEGFIKYSYPWVFNFLPYSFLLGIITQFLHFQSTFIWNFSDLFVICMSYYLTSRINQINKKLQAAQGKYLPEVFWRTTREDYGRATQLVRSTDEVISGIVFISFANNLFFVCLQLFNTLDNGLKGSSQCDKRSKGSSPVGGYETAAYFLFSLVYLLTRSVAVSLIASEVNAASLVPAPILYDVPSPVYGVEVQRFIDQVNGDEVALSGLQFFNVTRGLLLTVAGTIVTYELVMVQFSAPAPPPLGSNSSHILSNMTLTTLRP